MASFIQRNMKLFSSPFHICSNNLLLVINITIQKVYFSKQWSGYCGQKTWEFAHKELATKANKRFELIKAAHKNLLGFLTLFSFG